MNNYFILKEIEDEPKAFKATVNKYVRNKNIELGLPADLLLNLEYVYYVGSGSSFNACKIGEYLILRYFKHVNVRAILASEFIFHTDQLKKENSLAIFVSRSGETSDVVVALSYCKLLGIKTLAITNNPLSRLAYEADYHLYTQTQSEVAVATTKSFVCQLALIYLLGIKTKHLKLLSDQNVSDDFANSVRDRYIQTLKTIPTLMDDILKKKADVQKVAKLIFNKQNLLLLGGIDLPICFEGALKIKELDNIHAEAIPVGELSHGSLVLVDENLYSILVSTSVNNSHEIRGAADIKTRNGKLISIITDIEENRILEETSDHVFKIPDLKEAAFYSTSLTVIYLQLLAYFIAVEKDLDPDRPRNLAKSITVE